MSTQETIRSRPRIHRDRLIEDTEHDAYREHQKPREPALCPGCGAVLEHGHWQWKIRPDGASEHVCAACRRIRDQQPAGYVTLQGRFFEAHAEEILGLLHNEELRAKSEHPLERVMSTERSEKKTIIQTTDVHLARRLGDALHHAYRGELDIQYARDDYVVRVYWTR